MDPVEEDLVMVEQPALAVREDAASAAPRTSIASEQATMSLRDEFSVPSVASVVSPFPQYDVPLSVHKAYRTIASASYDYIKPRRSVNLDVEDVRRLLHQENKKRFGESVPKPTFWIPANKVTGEKDFWKVRPGTLQNFAVGVKSKAKDFYQASDEYVIDENIKNGRGREREKKEPVESSTFETVQEGKEGEDEKEKDDDDKEAGIEANQVKQTNIKPPKSCSSATSPPWLAAAAACGRPSLAAASQSGVAALAAMPQHQECDSRQPEPRNRNLAFWVDEACQLSYPPTNIKDLSIPGHFRSGSDEMSDISMPIFQSMAFYHPNEGRTERQAKRLDRARPGWLPTAPVNRSSEDTAMIATMLEASNGLGSASNSLDNMSWIENPLAGGISTAQDSSSFMNGSHTSGTGSGRSLSISALAGTQDSLQQQVEEQQPIEHVSPTRLRYPLSNGSRKRERGVSFDGTSTIFSELSKTMNALELSDNLSALDLAGISYQP